MRLLPFATIGFFVCLASHGAEAQIIRPRFQVGQPTAFLSLGVGLQQGWSVNDGASNSLWQFSDATQYVAAIEKALSGGASLGLRGTYAKVPMQYRSLLGGDAIVQEDADANVSQLFGTLHVANGRGFHSVLDLSAGATMYSKFIARSDGRRLNTVSNDLDFTFAFGYGFGYAFSQNFSVDVVQDVATSLHQRTGLSAGQESSTRLHSTRLVGRFGLGGR
ncbi:MAG: hypothetical protein JWL61_1222 [Gemmatimonadetes bacterium]|nr:hypothetical protein [Gemmatimonadota bacterium]